jgi:putative transposase
VTVLDWASRRVLAWRLSNTLTADFCVEALEMAMRHYGVEQIIQTFDFQQVEKAYGKLLGQ